MNSLAILTYSSAYAIISVTENKGGFIWLSLALQKREKILSITKNVNNNHEPIYISGNNAENNAVIIGLEDWKSIQETIYLESTGTMDKVREREKDNSGTTNIDDIDWDNL